MSAAERPAVFAGQFYPANPGRCRAAIDEMLPETPPPASLCAIVPHAGWVYSGPTAALSWASIAASEPDTVVIFGAAHGPDRNAGSLYARGRWQTPLGPIEVDEGLAGRFLTVEGVAQSPEAHGREHSIEVQLPILKRLLPRAKVVPINVPPGRRSAAVGASCARVAQQAGGRVAFVGSTDLTHYGPAFGFEPEGHGSAGVRWAKEVNDRRVIALIAALDADAIVREARDHRNACGGGAVAATVAAARTLGATVYHELQHTCSAETAQAGGLDMSNSVGYEAGVFLAGG